MIDAIKEFISNVGYETGRVIDGILRRSVMKHLREASVSEISNWIRVRLDIYPYQKFIPSSEPIYIATSNFCLPALYGVDLVNVIVPGSITVRFSDLGHSTLYLEDGQLISNIPDPFVSVSNELIEYIQMRQLANLHNHKTA